MHNTLEEHVRDAICPRCKQEVHAPWQSEFFKTIHYITCMCSSCNYKLFYKADFISNGIEK